MAIVIIIGVISLFGFSQVFELDVIETTMLVAAIIGIPAAIEHFVKSDDCREFEDKYSEPVHLALLAGAYVVIAFIVYKMTYDSFYQALDSRGARDSAPIMLFSMALILTFPLLSALWLVADFAGVFTRIMAGGGNMGGGSKPPFARPDLNADSDEDSESDETDYEYDPSRFPDLDKTTPGSTVIH
nr:hypothetical protein [uncultured Shinella sp.]